MAGRYAAAISGRFEALEGLRDPVQLWDTFKRNTLEAANECIGEKPRIKESFITSETLAAIEESRRARLNKSDLRWDLRRQARSSLRRDKERYVRGLLDVVEKHLNTGDSKPAFRALKQLRSKSSPRMSSVKAVDGGLLTDPAECRDRWAEYFEELFMAPPPAQQLDTGGVSVRAASPSLSDDLPTLEETQRAVDKLKAGKAAGICGIPGELLKAGGADVIKGLHSVLCAVWESGIIPPDWIKGLVVPIWKGKGDQQDCNNYRGVTLLSVPGKVLAQLLLSRIRDHLLSSQRPEQAGFTPKRSTTDRILGLRALIECRHEYQQKLIVAYVDFRKAFYSVNREALWELLRLRGVPAGVLRLISGLYSDTVSAVRCGGSMSRSFPVTTGVRQGCVLAPTLFNTCMDWILERMMMQDPCGVSVGEVKISDFDFADDVALLDEVLDTLVLSLDALSRVAEPLGLKVSWVKTKIQAFGDLLDGVKSVAVGGENVEVVDKFTYLGSVIQSDGSAKRIPSRRSTWRLSGDLVWPTRLWRV